MPFFPLLQPGADRRILLDIMDAEFFEQRGVLVGEADEQIAAGIAMTIDLHRRDVGDVPFLEMDVFAADLDRARAGNAHFELVRVPADRHRLLARSAERRGGKECVSTCSSRW